MQFFFIIVCCAVGVRFIVAVESPFYFCLFVCQMLERESKGSLSRKFLKLNKKRERRESKIIASSNDELPRQRECLQLLTYSSFVYTQKAS